MKDGENHMVQRTNINMSWLSVNQVSVLSTRMSSPYFSSGCQVFFWSVKRMRHQEIAITSIYFISKGVEDYRRDDSIPVLQANSRASDSLEKI